MQNIHSFLDKKCKNIYAIAMGKNLKEIRKKAKMTQSEAAALLNVSLRSYKSYENDPDKHNTIKYKYMVNELSDIIKVDETHGMVDIDDIRNICASVFKDYSVDYCYLFGSYAKGKATESSDIDLLLSTNLKGIKYFGLVEHLRENLHKNVDVLNVEQLQNNFDLTKEILRDGVKIYG